MNLNMKNPYLFLSRPLPPRHTHTTLQAALHMVWMFRCFSPARRGVDRKDPPPRAPDNKPGRGYAHGVLFDTAPQPAGAVADEGGWGGCSVLGQKKG